jgi:transposase
VPSKVTFSRAFAAFAADRLPERVHAAMVEAGLGGGVVGHMSVDSTAIEAREAAAKAKGKGKGKGKAPKRLEVQPARPPEESLADLPRRCDRGVKRNSRGNVATWTGYKLHLAVADGGVPMCAALTGASTHDSQAAIPLVKMGAERATVLYVLADSAYDAEAIRGCVRSMGQVPIIEPNKRNGGSRRLDPAERARYGERTTVERVNAWLKDSYGGRFVRVRGAAKVMAHLMFGVVALTAARLFALTG